MSTKTAVLQIRLSEAEKAQIKASAQREQLPMAAWIRRVLLGANLRGGRTRKGAAKDSR